MTENPSLLQLLRPAATRGKREWEKDSARTRKPEQFAPKNPHKPTTRAFGFRVVLFTSGWGMEMPSDSTQLLPQKSRRGEQPPSSGRGRVAAPLLVVVVVVVPLPPWQRRRRYALPLLLLLRLLATQGDEEHTPH